MKSILDPTFQYTPSHATNIRERFDRVRKELKIPERKPPVVVPIRKPTKGQA